MRKKTPIHHDAGDDVWDEQTPFDVAVASERVELVRRAIQSLKIEYREVILLREFDGFSYAEIAEITGDSDSSVKSRLFKARKALIKKLEPLFGKECVR